MFSLALIPPLADFLSILSRAEVLSDAFAARLHTTVCVLTSAAAPIPYARTDVAGYMARTRSVHAFSGKPTRSSVARYTTADGTEVHVRDVTPVCVSIIDWPLFMSALCGCGCGIAALVESTFLVSSVLAVSENVDSHRMRARLHCRQQYVGLCGHACSANISSHRMFAHIRRRYRTLMSTICRSCRRWTD
jgi:hypothetical protein